MLFWSPLNFAIKKGFSDLFLILLYVIYGACSNDLPKLLKLPHDILFASSIYDTISFNVMMSPFDVKFLLLVRFHKSSQSSRYEFQTLYNSSKDHFVINSPSSYELTIKDTSHINKYNNYLSVNLTIIGWHNFKNHPIHIRVISDSGSFLSPPIKIQIYQLSEFEDDLNEKVEFLMGNVAQILCRLPVSKPSPPKIEFFHNSSVINVNSSSRYKIVEFPPLYHTVALLIRNLMEEDSGQYKCRISLPNTKLQQESIKTTTLIVKKPFANVPIKFLTSSHSNIDDNKIIDIRIPEGTLLVIYCIFESAPVEEVSWYWPKSDMKYELNQQFGTLTIHNASLQDNSDISCMNNENKIFRIHVYQKLRLIANPARVELKKSYFNKFLTIKCILNQNEDENYVINWLHNGVIIYNDRQYDIGNYSLTIRKLTPRNQGIYQCWTEIKNEWLSDQVYVYFPRKNVKELHSVRILYVDPDRPVDLRCEVPINYNVQNSTTRWFRKFTGKEITNSSLDFSKKFDYENNAFILTVKNPFTWKNNQSFICKIFYKENKKILLRKLEFRLLFNKVIRQNQSPDPRETVKDSFFYFKISKPIAVRPKSFLLAVNVSWSLQTSKTDNNQSKIINHYRIEYRQGVLKMKPVEGKLLDPFIEWGNATIIEKSFTTPSCVIYNSQILKPKYLYSFRAVGIPNFENVKFQEKKNILSINFFQEIRSPWSDPVNFDNIMQSRPKISNITILNSESAIVSWIYSSLSEILDSQAKSNIEYKILYREILLENSIKSFGSINEQVTDLRIDPDFYYNDLTGNKIETATKISSFHDEKVDLIITNLKANTQYLVAIYAIHRPLTGMSMMYTTLSDTRIMDTSLVGSKTILTDSNNNSKNQTITNSNYFRNKILFLVLGSLAGILFVIALFMFIMCLWYQIRYHNKKRQNISSTSSVKTSSATTFAPIGTANQISNNSVFVTSSNIVSPQGLSPWNKHNRFTNTAEFPHLYLAQHLSLWSPNHLAQFNLPNNIQDQIVDEMKIKKPNNSPTTLSTPSPKSNIDLEINNLDGSIEDSQEESVRLLDYQSHSSGYKREDQCTLNNAFSVKSEGRDRQNDQDASSYNTRSISHYPFSPSALELYSHKKKTKVCSSNRKDLSNIKLHLKQPKLQNSNYFLPIRSRLSCFFPSAPSGESPPPCTPVISSLCKDNSPNQYNRMKKDETFAEHPFLMTDNIKNGFITNYGNGSFKYHYSPSNNFPNQKLPSKFIFDPIHDLQPHDDSRSNSTAASARQFLFSLYPDGVRPSINLDLDKQASNSQTNL